ncbi:9052_t:CDS:2, partial [Acaulospora morrowiae]
AVAVSLGQFIQYNFSIISYEDTNNITLDTDGTVIRYYHQVLSLRKPTYKKERFSLYDHVVQLLPCHPPAKSFAPSFEGSFFFTLTNTENDFLGVIIRFIAYDQKMGEGFDEAFTTEFRKRYSGKWRGM